MSFVTSKALYARVVLAAALGIALLGHPALAQGADQGATKAQSTQKAAGQNHSHNHKHDHGQERTAAKGYFEDAEVGARELSDWAGDWQSVYPYLQDGTLDPVWVHKAEHGDKSAEEYRAYYEKGYVTDVSRITIEGARVSFYSPSGVVAGDYVSDGQEILTYKKGNRGVRFIFRKETGDAGAPAFIQFSDHIIAPQKSDHYHLYWGDDRAALLQEVSHWPTYYPSELSAQQIVSEMTAH